MKNISAEDALKIWQKEGLIEKKDVQKFKSVLHKSEDGGVGRGIVIFATIGAILVGLGVLLFIGSNWKEMAPIHRILVIAAGYATVMFGAITAQERKLPIVAESLWFLTCILLGANIALLGQIFHFSLTFWQGPFLWMLGVLAMGYAREQKAYGALAVPLGLLALGWLGGGEGWFMDDQMEFLFSDRGLRPLLSFIGIGLIAGGILTRPFAEWLDGSLEKWGALFIAIPLIVSTADADVVHEFYQATFSLKQIIIIFCVTITVFLASLKGQLENDKSRMALVAVAGLLIIPLIHVGGEPALGLFVHQGILQFMSYILAVFMLSLVSIWFGVQSANQVLVNTGITTVSIIILIQYFSWTFEMLHSSLAFILGGVVLIGLSVFMEKTRRKLLASIHS